MRGHLKAACAALALLGTLSCGQPAPVPDWEHIVIVIEENQDASAVMGEPYISALAAQGMVLTSMYGITHPSQPNYIALFSGSQQGVTDNLPHDITAPNLATALDAAGLTFTCWSEDLPASGSTAWTSGKYVRRHNPAASFTNVTAAGNMPFSSFPSDYTQLPTVSFVVPNLDNDMHDGTIAQGDAWLQANLDGYVQWAVTHNSLFILTFDECAPANPVATTPIATILVGDGVGTGTISSRVDLYSLLRLVMETYGLGALGEDRYAPAIEGFSR